MLRIRNNFITFSLALFPLFAACGSNSPGSDNEDNSTDPQEDRGPIGKADMVGSCQGHCGGKSEGNCWCDDSCTGYGDCCADVDICTSDPICGDEGHEYNYAFSESDHGWKEIFADYPEGWETQMELEADYKQSPEYTESGMALFISGYNNSDDVFMGYKKLVEGLKPNTLYELSIHIELLSKYEWGSYGIGGSPANSVYLKAGATKVEPEAVKVNDMDLRLNIDKSNGASGGSDMVKLGDISKPRDGNTNYVMIERNNETPLEVESDSNGNIWLIFGTDSGYEGITALYYTRFSANFVCLP